MDPRLRSVIDQVLRDPEIAQLVREVDMSLLEWTASLEPFERVRVANEKARAFRSFVLVDDRVREDSANDASDAPEPG
ncbi:MAG: hypothetical protein H6721_25785 [Sandaracinus sp.]|nr:hypothetical protein [Sandaracinus sp.]MCB9635544.1 hypothetical protein [Sandaracinus sp.]